MKLTKKNNFIIITLMLVYSVSFSQINILGTSAASFSINSGNSNDSSKLVLKDSNGDDFDIKADENKLTLTCATCTDDKVTISNDGELFASQRLATDGRLDVIGNIQLGGGFYSAPLRGSTTRFYGRYTMQNTLDVLGKLTAVKIGADEIRTVDFFSDTFETNRIYISNVSARGGGLNPVSVRAKIKLESYYGTKSQAIEFHDFPTYVNDDAFGSIEYTTTNKEFHISANKHQDGLSGRTHGDIILKRDSNNHTVMGINALGGELVPGYTLTVDGKAFFSERGHPLTSVSPEILEEFEILVEGQIMADNLAIQDRDTWGADYVFEDDYNLTSLEDLKNFVKTNKHLPGVPGVGDVKDAGYYMVDDMLVGQLKNLEELLLHTINQEANIKALQDENKLLKAKIDQIFAKLEDINNN